MKDIMAGSIDVPILKLIFKKLSWLKRREPKTFKPFNMSFRGYNIHRIGVILKFVINHNPFFLYFGNCTTMADNLVVKFIYNIIYYFKHNKFLL